MKKFLPNTLKNPQGFTLIELLTVVAIIAILSVIAITIFSSTQKNARDGARRAEVKAIANALEVNKTGAGYQPLAGSSFASGSVPGVDQQSIPYCINPSSAVANPATAWTSAGCPAAPAGYVAVAAGVPAVTPSFKVCSIIENPTNSVFCISSAQ